MQNKICKFITTGDIANLDKASHKPLALQAEAVLKQFRSLAKDCGKLSDQDRTSLITKLDTSVVRFMMGKAMTDKFENLTSLALHFVEELRKASGVAVECPWAPNEGKEQGTQASALPNFVQFDSQGNAVGASKLALKNLGVVADVHVKDKDGKVGKVKSVAEDGKVTIAFPPKGSGKKDSEKKDSEKKGSEKKGKGSEKKAPEKKGSAEKPDTEQASDDEGLETVSYDEWLSKYELAGPPAEYMDWAAVAPSESKGYQEAVIKAHIQAAMATLGSNRGNPKVELQVKPNRAVFAGAAFTTNKLCLVPESQRIVSVSADATAPVGSLMCTVNGQEDQNFYICPMFNDSFGCPAWAVKASSVKDESNLEVGYKKVHIAITAMAVTTSLKVDLPVLTNICDLKKGDELVLYRPAPSKAKTAKRELQMKSVSEPAKTRQRAS